MTLLLNRFVVTVDKPQGKKKQKFRISYPPTHVKHPLITDEAIPMFEEMNSKQIRQWLRKVAKLPPKNKYGQPFAYRIYIFGAGEIRTLFPKTDKNEELPIHGRIDIP